ncbi:MAG: hypothetical protein ACUVTU_00655 [Desulfurispora sp.]|uniref:hypothetical protein n=1 Tax=Desulfurispora sp. TaxID=3014275 RepID=UPI00404AD45C
MLLARYRPAAGLLLVFFLFLSAGCTLPWQKKTPEKPPAPASPVRTTAAEAPARVAHPAAAAAAPAPSRPRAAVTVLEPLPAVTAQQPIEVRGRTKPGLQVFINNLPVPVEANGTFQTTLELQPGPNQLRINTLGQAGVLEEQKLAITYQPPPPRLLVVAPAASDTEILMVSGKAAPEDILYVNSTPVRPGKEGHFTVPVRLKPGQNEITVLAVSPAGGRSEVKKKVSFHPPPPRLAVIVPPETRSKQVTISGITDENAVLVLYVNDSRSEISRQSGQFSATLQLQEGLNLINVQAINKWGQKTEYSSTIYCNLTG